VPWIPGAAHAGFAFRLGSRFALPRHLELIGLRDGARSRRYGTLLRSPADERIPVPPLAIASPSSGLARRQHPDDAVERWVWERGFLAGGLAAAANLLEQVEVHGGGPQGLRLLDWGSGCGRVTRHLLDKGFGSISGCDLDAQSISWCQENLPGADFSTSGPEPPLPVEDASLDVVIGCSVVTHLDAALQARWLAELRRVTVQGGLVLLSTQGDFAYRRGVLRRARVLHRWPRVLRLAAGRLSRKLAREGLVDRGATRALEGIAPRGYYRSIAQSPAYTRREWSSHFEILDQIECGLGGNQDLVVMRRP
jgi:SAM-dependent methyltransferase